MSRLVLFRAIASPPARSVMMLGDLLGLKFEYKEVQLLKMEHKSEEYKKNINPMGTVPVLQDGDFILSESHAILKYLTERYGGARGDALYPRDVRARALVDQAMFFNSGFFFPRMSAVAIPLLVYGRQTGSPSEVKAVEEAYAVADAYLRARPFVAGDRLTLADLSVGSTATATQQLVELDQDRFPHLAKWLNELQEIPCFKNINAEGVAYFKTFIEKARKYVELKSQKKS